VILDLYLSRSKSDLRDSQSIELVKTRATHLQHQEIDVLSM